MLKLFPFWRCAVTAIVLTLSSATTSAESTLDGCDVSHGEKLFDKCAVCHTNDNNGKHGFVGPNLYGIVGRAVGKVEGYKFSSSLRKSEDQWTTTLLNSFLKRPMDVYPRTRMAFSGISKTQDRADLICFLSASRSTKH